MVKTIIIILIILIILIMIVTVMVTVIVIVTVTVIITAILKIKRIGGKERDYSFCRGPRLSETLPFLTPPVVIFLEK